MEGGGGFLIKKSDINTFSLAKSRSDILGGREKERRGKLMPYFLLLIMPNPILRIDISSIWRERKTERKAIVVMGLET